MRLPSATLLLFSTVVLATALPHEGVEHTKQLTAEESDSTQTETSEAMDMDMDMKMDMDNSQDKAEPGATPIAHRPMHHHGMPILQTNLYPEERAYWESYNTTTFLNYSNSNKAALYAHISLLSFIVIMLYPICLVLNNANSKWYLPALVLNYAATLGCLFALAVFGGSVPDLYPKNAYTRMSYILLVAMTVHLICAIIHHGIKYLSNENKPNDGGDFIPLKTYTHSRGSSSLSPSSTLYDFQNFDVNTTFENSRISAAHSESTLGRIPESFEEDEEEDLVVSSEPQVRFSDNDGEDFDVNEETHLDPELGDEEVRPNNRRFDAVSNKRDYLYKKVFHQNFVRNVLSKFGNLATFVFVLTNYLMLGYLMIYFMTGTSVGNLLGQGNKVFNLLAHFIKGGVFFLLGLVSLARYMGCYEHMGLAWNSVKFKQSEKKSSDSWFIKYSPMKGLITMEFVESFLIWFYGSTNVFLEHLANPGGEWAAKDLQHVSIAFMYIGLGLCGLLTEFGLSEWRFRKVMEHYDNNRHPTKQIQYASPGYSPNPFPAFTIFWTGILMSQHAQASQTSTTIHAQWGYMLSYGAIVRMISYVICLFSKDSKYELREDKVHNSLKPFTELIVSSCLLSGGMIFMESTDQVVEALEYRGLTPMFTLNVSVGIVALLMGWEMLLLFWRQWLLKRN